MLLKFLLLFFLVGNIVVKDQRKEIDFNPKQLQKELKKANLEKSQLYEIESIGVSNKIFSLNYQGEINGYVYIGRVNSCRAGGCNNPRLEAGNNNPEYFDYFILFNTNKQVELVRVFNYQATHGYEISSKGWLKQFHGHHAENQLKVSKNIDQISGATISVNAIVDDISFVTNTIQKL